MEPLMLIARIAGQRVGLTADAIESVVEIDAITPVPLAPPHVAGLAALRSRVLTVIDSYAALAFGQGPRATPCRAVVVTIDNHLYGLLVDEVEDVVAIGGETMPLHGGLAHGWRESAIGLVEHGGHAVLLLDSARLVAGPMAAAA